MPHGLAKKVKKRMNEAYKHIEAQGCATVASVAGALNVPWDRARHVVDLLKKEGRVVEVEYGGKLLWCVNEEAAEEAIYNIRAEVWRLICSNKLRYVSPSRLAQLMISDARARKLFAKYVSIKNAANAGGIKFADAVLRDLLGAAFDRRTNKKIYMVPADFCAKPPRREAPKRYKQRRNIVTFRVTEAMARDVEKAAAVLGVGKAELVRMAVEHLLNQYRHVGSEI